MQRWQSLRTSTGRTGSRPRCWSAWSRKAPPSVVMTNPKGHKMTGLLLLTGCGKRTNTACLRARLRMGRSCIPTDRARGAQTREFLCCMALRLAACALLVAAFALAQVPAEAIRWKAVEGTKYSYPMPHYDTRGQWEMRKEHLRKQVLAAAGLLPMPARGPVHAEIFGKMEGEGYSIEKVYLETLPGYYLCGNLYRPRGKSGKLPAVLTPHGHWKNGRLENTELASVPGRSIDLAR